jgi:hypothetical protein
MISHSLMKILMKCDRFFLYVFEQLKNEERLIDGKNETEWLTCIPDHLRKEVCV